MSSQLVGHVYQKIMDEVINSCQVTFEEDGVNKQTLDDLRTTWQIKLTQLNVGTFPWEPPPAPQPMVIPVPVPSNVPRSQNTPSTSASVPSLPASGNGVSGVRPKVEPNSSYNGQGVAQAGGMHNYSNGIAQQRAAQNLQQKFGPSANVQVNQLRAQAVMGAPVSQSQSNPQNSQLPSHYSEQQKGELNDLKRQQQQRQYQNLQQAQQSSSVSNSQVDGATEWDAMVAQRHAEAVQNPTANYEAEMTLRDRVEQMSHSMEGGGLMVPLSEQPMRFQREKGKFSKQAASASHLPSPNTAQLAIATKVAQLDGLDESDEDNVKDDPDLDNEDAINSDLDDPEENVVEDDDDEEGKRGQIMLCTYDKVQRVKNKWKCTLKDGVLTTGGKEYVFNKAQGEFEW